MLSHNSGNSSVWVTNEKWTTTNIQGMIEEEIEEYRLLLKILALCIQIFLFEMVW
jgi:hypothetical protein